MTKILLDELTQKEILRLARNNKWKSKSKFAFSMRYKCTIPHTHASLHSFMSRSMMINHYYLFLSSGPNYSKSFSESFSKTVFKIAYRSAETVPYADYDD